MRLGIYIDYILLEGFEYNERNRFAWKMQDYARLDDVDEFGNQWRGGKEKWERCWGYRRINMR